MTSSRTLYVIFLVLVVVAGIWTATHGANWTGSDDEGFRLHAAWMTAQGNLPYRDFFDNQMPNFKFLSAPILALTGNQPGPLRGMQWFYFAVLGGSLLMLCKRTSGGLLAGVLAIFLVAASPITGRVTGEFRPDLPALALALIGAGLLRHGLITDRGSRSFALSGGTVIALAIFVKPSAVFVLPAIFIFCYLSRKRSSCAVVSSWFMVGLIVTTGLQLLLWTTLSPKFLQYTLGTHQLAVPSADISPVLLQALTYHLPLAAGLILYLGWLRAWSTLSKAFLMGGMIALAFYALSPPNTPQVRHLFGIIVLLAVPSAEAFSELMRRYQLDQPPLKTWICSFTLIIATIIVVMNSPLNRKNHIKELTDWIRRNTSPQAYVLTDFPYLNFLARRPQPPALANVSSNLTYTGFIDEERIDRALASTPPELILLQLKPHPWHLANVPGMESIILSWLPDYSFQGLKTPSNEIFMVFTPSKETLPGVQSDPEILRRKLAPLLKTFDWNALSQRLIPETKN